MIVMAGLQTCRTYRRCYARCYTSLVPTKHPRHAITETPDVRAALDAVRAATGEARPNLAELVVLGAGVKAEAALADRRRNDKALAELVEMVLSRSIPVDVAAADEVKRIRLEP
jgi:hypothetical protein